MLFQQSLLGAATPYVFTSCSYITYNLLLDYVSYKKYIIYICIPKYVYIYMYYVWVMSASIRIHVCVCVCVCVCVSASNRIHVDGCI